MRVIRKPSMQYLIRLSQVVSLDQIQTDNDERHGNHTSLAHYLVAPEPPEDRNVMVEEELFRRLMPGPERICVTLRADGYTLESIQEITGYSAEQIKRVFLDVRTRLAPRATLDEVSS